MKKFNSILFCAAAVLAVASCNKEAQEVLEAKRDLIPMTFTATTTETRTALGEDHVSIKWLKTDKISVFDGVANRMFSSNGEGTSVQFTGEASDATNYLAVYPYNEGTRFFGTLAKTTLAADQTPVDGTFADGLNINAATSSDKSSFHFENVLSVAKFTLNASNLGGKTIKSVKFASTHPLAGDVDVLISPEEISASAGDNTVKEVTMTSESGLADGTYYFVVLPNAGGEITMTFESTDGYLARKTATLGKAFTAGSIKNLGSVKGLVWTKVFFYESFDLCQGKGGNDGLWSDTNAFSDVNTDNEGWAFANEGGANQCVKLGSSSKKGTATTPSIALSGDVKLAFKAGAWDGNKEQTELILSAENATMSSSSVAMVKGEFTDYDLALNNASDGEKVTFAGKYASNSRFFLDEVLVYVGDKELAYSLAKGSEDPVEPIVTVEAPAFNPNGGTFTTAQSVTITSSTEGATIYYTTDGNDPTTSTTTTVENGGAVTISSSCTLKAIAVKDGVASSVSSANFTINNGSAYPSPVSFDTADFEGQGTSGSGSALSVVKSPITISSDKGYCEGREHVRLYETGKLTVSANGKTITKIEITSIASGTAKYGPTTISTNTGTYKYSGKVGTWTGSASSVVFNADKQFRFTDIVVTYN